jgi:hypothetical protein
MTGGFYGSLMRICDLLMLAGGHRLPDTYRGDALRATRLARLQGHPGHLQHQRGAGALENLVIVVHNYSAAAAPSSILVNGASKVADVDYFASVDTASKQLWLTLKGSFRANTTASVANNAPPFAPTGYLPLLCNRC